MFIFSLWAFNMKFFNHVLITTQVFVLLIKVAFFWEKKIMIEKVQCRRFTQNP